MTEKIIPTLIEKEMKDSYLDYSMSVIVGRALPDVRDGLKPVHRRILFAMYDMGLQYNKPFKKCARVVGDTMGKLHPHGDLAIYDALVRMAQDFNLRYTLVKGQGNFGATDFAAAASRYTECKLNKIAEEILADIDKDTVDFVPNFDGSLKEPTVLPSKIPNLLMNGSSGIAVGMATNIPPHNITEVCDALIEIIDNKDVEDSKLFIHIKGPDFPTGAQIIGTNGIRNAYRTGKGKIIIRSKVQIEDNNIIITEIPYQISKSSLIEQIADLVKEKIIEGISDIRDESDKEGLRILIELKKNSDPNLILNQLYKNSQLQVTFGIINLALVNGEPKVLSLKEMCLEFIKHRKEVVTRRTRYELRKAEERDHILQGLLVALKSIDEVVSLIKKSKDIENARNVLITNYALTEIQANAILDMKLSKLAALEQQKILDEHNELLKFISGMKEILASENKIYAIINDELIGIKNEYSDKRRTEIIEGEEENIETEDLIEKEQVVVTTTHSGYIKRQSLDTYRAQKRGGRGIIGTETKEEDFVEHLFVANTHSYILFFTDKGVVHWLKTYKIPEAGRYARGSAVINLLKLNQDEKITSMVAVDEFKENNYLVMATKNGIIKKTSLVEYSRPRQGGIIGINLRENDRLIDVKMTDGTKQMIIATKDGRAVRFKESDVNAVGRNSIGVRGINVRNSKVVGMEIVNAPYLLTVTEKGYGKRSEVNDYRLINRGGSGVTNIKITEKNGNVVGIKIISENDEIMLISKNGVIIRTPVSGISVIGRNTQGVRIMNLEEGDGLATVARIINEESDLDRKEDFKPSDESLPSDDVVNDGEEIENAADEIKFIEDNKEIINDNDQEIKNDSNISEEEIKEFLEKNNVDSKKEEKSSKKDFTLEGYGGN
ncbi:DNA gyrase subunit A [Candidatus Woesearchaeota archaeon]|nr:DNA gyrase subunit A [Candidatus Woesearchaeota archaeon]